MGNLNQPLLPQTTVPFGQQREFSALAALAAVTAAPQVTGLIACSVLAAPQVGAPENHFGQVDVNDLLSKLINTGIIKPLQPEAPPASGTGE